VEKGGQEDEKASRMYDMKRKALGQGVRNWCVVQELGERKLLKTVEEGEFFGPMVEHGRTVPFKESLDHFMERVDDWRRDELYPHKCTSQECAKRGCEKVVIVDGLWKLSYPICMFDNIQSVPEDIQQYVPHDCTNAPATNKAFCSAHCSQLEELNVPTGLREFITFCGASSSNFTKEGKSKVKEKLAILAKQVKSVEGTSSVEAQGVSYFLRNRDIANADQLQELPLPGKEDCRKDVGEPLRLRRRSRGLLPFIAGGGIIRSWDVLFRSEGATQVAFLMIKFLMKFLKDIDPAKWQEYYLCYDNMCHVDRLKLLRNLLPLAEPFPPIWLKVKKIIDDLHIKNHKPPCDVTYSPELVKENFPEANLMTCEQTFAWLGRFRKVLNSTPKVHYHFIIHRLVITRNKYTEYCYAEGKKPLLPSAKFQTD